ncbi:MAG: hypothetical protein ACOC6P_03035 [Candidatus Aminicenantaceae bacterium]
MTNKVETRTSKSKKWMMLCAVLPALLLLSGCFCVEIKQNIKNPDKHFREAYRQIKSLHRMFPDRKGPVSHIHVLVYEESELQLIRVEAPMWLIDMCMDHCDTYDIDTECDFDFSEIKNFRDIGPGMLLEVDGENSKILIWMD